MNRKTKRKNTNKRIKAGDGVASYTRVSSEDQVKGFSLSAQKQRNEHHVAALGKKVVARYTDHHTGRNIRRPGYERMMAERANWDVLVVTRMDRIHRNSRNFLAMMDILKKEGKGFVSVTESLDTTTPMGEFVMGIIAGIAQLESGLIGWRVSEGVKEKLRTTDKSHGAACFGLRRSNGLFVVHKKEATFVVWMATRLLAGDLPSSIAAVLNKKGVKTRNGYEWNGPRIMQLLSNPLLAGCRLSKAYPKLATHEATLAWPIFWKVQDVCAARRRKHRPDVKNTKWGQRLALLRRLYNAAKH
jgi:DNA invertase Pin-like site-specific DNA recombinase